jgi:hypothetical protein
MSEMKEKSLQIVSDTLNKSTKDWTEVREFCGTVLDCTEFISETKSSRFSRGLLGSSREIENILREKNPTLLQDFQNMANIIANIQQIWADRAQGISMAIIASSEALGLLQDLEEE